MKTKIETLENEIKYWQNQPKSEGLILQLQEELNNLKQLNILLDYLNNL
jgi:hypothetical protein